MRDLLSLIFSVLGFSGLGFWFRAKLFLGAELKRTRKVTTAFLRLSYIPEKILSQHCGGNRSSGLHRGAQHPMPEPPVQLESFNKSASLEPFKHFSQFRIQEGLLLPAFSVDGDGQAQLPPAAPPTLRELQSDDEQSSDSSADEACDLGDAEEMVLASSTGVYHSMLRASEEMGLAYKGVSLRAACGVSLHQETVRWAECFSPSLTLCRRRACCIILARCGAQLE